MMLNNKVVIITDVCGDFGRALAKAFVNEKAIVIGFGQTVEALEETKALINSPLFTSHQVDVCDYQALSGLVETIQQQNHHIGYLFNNAVVCPYVDFLTETASSFSKAIDLNVSGVANCCKAILPIMIQHQFGRIYNLGSWADLSPIENNAVYAASKGAIHALTKAIAKDIEKYQVDLQVHEWIPGAIKTPEGGFVDVSPDISSAWAVQIAKSDTAKVSCIYEGNKEWLPPKSFKQRIISKLRFWENSDHS